jgi:triacylglycerol esterase/lipase EstA (alpha/beta hydrolase family)
MTENSERADVQPRLWSRRAYSQSLRLARELSYVLTTLAVGGVIVFLLRRWYLRNTPLAMAKAAHLKWLFRPESPRSLRESYRSVARLIEWFDALPVEQRTDICRQLGLTIESDHFDETGLHRFSIAHHVPAYRLMRSHARGGIGVPVVAWRPNNNADKWDVLRPPEGIFAPATALLERRSDEHLTLRFLSPHYRESVSVGAHSYPLAANLTAPIAKLARTAEAFRRTGFRGMLNSSAIARREKLYLMQRYDPNRIPLLMVHGLQSTPVSLINLVNDLLADPEIHARYQIWQYHYRTGTPVLYNAAVLRRILKQTLSMLDPSGRDFATNNLFVLGHSMGGILTHTLICDSEYKLWDSVVIVRPELFGCDAKTSSVLNAIYLFERERRVRRAILISVPHRGSSVADNWIGNLGQTLYRADREVQEAFRSLLKNHLDQINPFIVRLIKDGKLSSIRTLSANSPALMALAAIPPAVPFHSLIGQKNPGPVQTGTDGVVTYASSHLDGAESEIIIPFGHEAFLHPDAVTEIKRILRGHLATL